MYKIVFFIFSGIVFSSARVSAQEIPPLQNAVQLYEASTAEQAALYNGTEYTEADPVIIGDPFYLTKAWSTGAVIYDGIEFKNQNLLYDIYKDQLIVKHFDNVSKLNLIREKVSAFSFLNHNFIYIESTDRSLTSGFYDVLYNGRWTVLAKREKLVVERTPSPTVLERRFEISNKYYLSYNNRYFQVKNLADVLKVFSDRKRELRNFINTSGLNFRKNPEQALAAVAKQYDELSK
ncbi:hypothetical protein [Rubrolithibacter danxiaensis]|uniref:hypothetical protein n=1 Tax=Rubrolithibacter danxiaensis TaxID=3390805 RepID=UPI003BF896AA